MRITAELLQRRLARDGMVSAAGLNLTAQELSLAGQGIHTETLKAWHEAQVRKAAPLRAAG